MKEGWGIHQDGEFTHIWPHNDYIQHHFGDCPCCPTPERDKPTIIVHHAIDMREEQEAQDRHDQIL